MKGIRKFIVHRLLWSIFVLFGLSILIFGIARIIPGDTATMALGTRATVEAKEAYQEKHHLNDPVPVQYVYWLKDAVSGDFGDSTQTKRPVVQDVKEYLPATLELILFAAILEIFGGVILGVLSARYEGGWFDNFIRVVSYLGIATPSFVWAILFMLIFSYKFPIMPTIGRLDSSIAEPTAVTGFMILDSMIAGNTRAAFSAFQHLVMPAAALAMAGIAQSARITRGSMLENMKKDFVGSEIASGMPLRRVYNKYVLKISATPTVSIIALDIAAMLGNAFLVEMIYSYPGLSKYGVNAIMNKDLNAIVAVVLIIGITFLIINIVVDIISAWLDPRIRL